MLFELRLSAFISYIYIYSLERIQDYIDIEHEKPPTEGGKPPASWPTSGALRAENLNARYSSVGRGL